MYLAVAQLAEQRKRSVVDDSLYVMIQSRAVMARLVFITERGAFMAKFNQPNTIKTENRSGYPAYRMAKKERFVTAVLTTMFGEPKYYGSTDNEIVKLAVEFAKEDPAFLCRLACYARNVGNMRSVSHVLAAVIAREAREYTRVTIRNIVLRPDDITEIMSCYLALYGKPFPNALKREVAEVIQKFDEYQLAKYNGGNKALKLRDVLRITHPTPADPEKETLFGKILNDTLETPYTWETELSARGNTKEVWDELIASGRVGYMALLRNLRNIVKSGADLQPVLETLSDPKQVKKSRQLPFRFYSAYRTLDQEKLLTPEIHKALETALTCSIDNMEPIPGRTLIAVDVSGSMSMPISGRSDVRCCDIAALLGAMASRICEDATVCYFDYLGYCSMERDVGYRIAHYGKYDSVLEICRKSAFAGGGTDLSLPMQYALEKDPTRHIKPFDRVIYFSDNECNNSHLGLQQTVQGQADKYRAEFNKDFWVHGVDLQGYGTQQFCGSRFNLVAGWSETVLPFVLMAERGFGSLVKTIEEYPL